MKVASSNVVITGTFDSTLNLARKSLDPFGGADAFALKLGINGEELWSRQIGGLDDEEEISVAIDSSGVVLLGGYFSGAVNFGNGLVTPMAADAYLARYEP